VLNRADGEMGIGEGELASTHNVKFSTARDLHLAINEFICM